eukprot:TRINITY_DN7024_c0_g1_i6.p1 TRINITY_DN7024_c0_g1~~TRINITY_DN7024_c0_g1_i6.p1  ORF type:complete len:362 (+),score=64.24 TRINITY_DN7024_c0_g1_i6:161-1246(+)
MCIRDRYKREQHHSSNEIAKEFLIDQIGFKRAKGYNLKEYDEIDQYFDSLENSEQSEEEEKLVQFNYDNEDKNSKTIEDEEEKQDPFEFEEEKIEQEQNLYFEKWQEFVQLESLFPVIKTTKGKTNQRDKNETNYIQFGTKQELNDYIKNIKQELSLKGFSINNSKLKVTLNVEEIADYKRKLAQYLNSQQSQQQQYHGKNSKNTKKKPPPQILIHQATKDLSDSEEEKRALSDKPINNLLQVQNKRQNRFKNLSANSSLSDLTDQIQSRSRSLSRSSDQAQPSDTGSVLGPMKNGTLSVMLAHKYEDNQVNPKGYFMSEKLDGIRCYWNGSKMFSRNGNQFFCPKWFTRGWPKSQLDGEL